MNMDELFLLIALLFAAYLLLPKSWLSGFIKKDKPATGLHDQKHCFVPEDSTLRRHYMTQLRCEIESELFPRPSDSTLQRHYDALVAEQLAYRLSR
jgi:hypothetical protein